MLPTGREENRNWGEIEQKGASDGLMLAVGQESTG